jgi:Fic family protein
VAYEPRFSVSPRLLALAEEIAALRTRVLDASVRAPWMPALQRDAQVKNTHSSTAIEGNPLSEEEVRLLADGHELPDVAERSRLEVLNYFAGLRFVEKNTRRRAITHELVLKLHSVVAEGVMHQGQAGEYRRMQVWVGVYEPPPPEEVSGLMSELLEWWNATARQWSPVVSSAVVHYRFEEIHPFADGNGRVGRMLALWELYRRGFDTHHIFSVDEFYWQDRPRYYNELRAARQGGGDLTAWLEYSAEGLRVTLEALWRRIARLAAGRASARLVLRPRQEQLLGLLRQRGRMAPREIWKALDVSRQGAMDLLRPLIEAGLVRKAGTRKSGRYELP